MASRVKRDAPHRLLVEGADDQHAVINLTARHGWDWEHPSPDLPLIEKGEGVEGVLEALPNAVKLYRRLGVVLDADVSPEDRWRALCSRLSSSGFVLPPRPAPDGTLVHCEGRRLGVWVMPNNQHPGKLEDFLQYMIPGDDPRWGHAGAATRSAKDLGAPFSEPDFIKAHLHTWLAWQEKPGLPYGQAITARVLAHDSPLAQTFADWMDRLFRQP